MSYGEATAVCNSGAFIALAEEVVYKHGILIIASAGNNGPAMSTSGCPGGTSTAVMGIAAYCSPRMMEVSACYNAMYAHVVMLLSANSTARTY
jgi:tripeptidyl-peptidase II